MSRPRKNTNTYDADASTRIRLTLAGAVMLVFAIGLTLVISGLMR